MVARFLRSFLANALLKSAAGVAAIRVAGMIAGFALTLVLSRWLGAEGVGTYAYVVTVLTLVAVPVSNGWSTLLLRTASKAPAIGGWDKVKGLIRWGVRLAVLLTLLVALLALGFLGTGAFGVVGAALLTGVLFLNQLSALRLAVLRGLNHPVWGQFPEALLRPLAILGLFVLYSAIRPGPPVLFDAFLALLSGALLTAVLGGVILWRKAPEVLRDADTVTDLPVWAKSASLLAGMTGLVQLNAQVDFLILGWLGTPADLGHYRVAVQIALLGGFVYTALNMIAMQRFAYLFARNETAELQSSATFFARLAFLFTLPLPILFWFRGEAVLNFLFTPGFVAVLAPLAWLFGVQIVNAAVGLPRTMLVMGNFEKQTMFFTALSLGINVVACLVLIPLFGVQGAAMSSFIALGIFNVALLVYSRRLLGVDTSILGNTIRQRSGEPT